MVKYASSLKICKLTANETAYGGGKAGTRASPVALAAGDTASTTGVDKIISASIKLPNQMIEQMDEVNAAAYGTDDYVAEVSADPSSLDMFFQTTTFYDLIVASTVGTITDSQLWHIEDGVAPIDLLGSYATKWSVKIDRGKPSIQTFEWGCRKAIASATVTNHVAASTATKSHSSNLTVLTIDSVTLANLELKSAVITIENEWTIVKILNDLFVYEATLKKRTILIDVTFLAPNNATWTNNWEYKMSLGTAQTPFSAVMTFDAPSLSKTFSNMIIKEFTGREYQNQNGETEFHAVFKSTGATTIA